MKESNGFNMPFVVLKGVKIKSKDRKTNKAAATEDIPLRRAEIGDNDSFISAMKGVKPIKNNMVMLDGKGHHPIGLDPRRKEDQEALDELKALVKGKVKFDITSTGEYMEGHVWSMDPSMLSKLKAGEFAIQAYIDLHGLIKGEAALDLGNFINSAYSKGHRSLLVIHGRGLKSKGEPVLKNSVVRWLTTGRLSSKVLAFCSARPCDGGTGALYVLLRKRAKKGKWIRPL
ncbi:MAG: Smr/MutS family protein [Thermodesulfobacteriota bacterium]|nr:Smr/MutS family protein [Thermodesulfobacteriota bacterium]